MTADEREIIAGLDEILRLEKVRVSIQPIAERVRAKLCRETGALMAWEPIPLTIYGGTLPDTIKSSWVFVLRAGANTGAERHPNSHQRMMSFQGSGDMQIWSMEHGAGSEERKDSRLAEPSKPKVTGQWKSNMLISDPDAPLEKRWISISQNVWHQPVISKEEDWIVVSFHTVPADELIEERREHERTKQMRYLE